MPTMDIWAVASRMKVKNCAGEFRLIPFAGLIYYMYSHAVIYFAFTGRLEEAKRVYDDLYDDYRGISKNIIILLFLRRLIPMCKIWSVLFPPLYSFTFVPKKLL